MNVLHFPLMFDPIKPIMGNLQVFSITNDYFASRSPLQCCKTDQSNLQSLCSELAIQHNSSHNFNKTMLLEKMKLTQQVRIKNSTATSTCIVYISGHGSYNSSNSISNFYSMDNEELTITNILTFFSDYENIFVIVDTCLVNSPKSKINISEIQNKGNVMISYSTTPFTTSIGTSEGSYFTNACIKAIRYLKDTNKYENLTLKQWLLIIGTSHIFYKEKGQISISANKNVRELVEYKKLMEAVKIEYVSHITVVNKKASDNIIIQQPINTLTDLFQVLDKIDNPNIHYAILVSLSKAKNIGIYECNDLVYLNILRFVTKHLDLKTQIVNFICKKIIIMELDSSSATVRLDILSFLKKIPNNLVLNSTDQQKEIQILRILTTCPDIKDEIKDYLKKISFV